MMAKLFRWNGILTALGAMGAVLWFYGSSTSAAQGFELACYRIPAPGNPDADRLPGSEAASLQEDTWCYRSIDNPQGATYIFNADPSAARPEMSAIVEADGTLVHASLLGGELTAHRLKSNYNPMPFPLRAPQDRPRVKEAEGRIFGSEAREALNFLLSTPAQTEDISFRGEGNFSAMVSAVVYPWRGFWWPYKSGRLYRGSASPLAKYDRYVQARTGTNPGAQAWEASNHKPTGLAWSGHCNGWAAASIMRREPRNPVRDPVSGVVFSVSDLKGILSEKDKCIRLAFFGHRYNGNPGDDLTDIYPGEFHNTLLYYIGVLKKPIAIDYMQGEGVENNVVSAYTMKIHKTEANAYNIEATLRIHEYDGQRTNKPGIAPSYAKVYKYKIWVDDQGQIINGVWLSQNPDFLWAPLGPNQCGTANPMVTEDWIQKITGG